MRITFLLRSLPVPNRTPFDWMSLGLSGTADCSFVRACCLTVLVLVTVVLQTACSRTDQNDKTAMPPVMVELARVSKADVPLFIDAIGNVAAYNTVDIKSRVTGELVKTFFKQGDFLTKGQQMFTIDSAPFESKVRESEAKLKQSKVQYEQAKREFRRFQVLHSEKAVSLEQLETKEVDMNSKLHQVELCQAELESAGLNLGYCFISSPLDGESGEIFMDNYNIVNANQDKLVTIKQIRPIKVKFSVPGKLLNEIRDYQRIAPLDVIAETLENRPPQSGKLALIDNFVNTKTGMIALEAIFANDETLLWPGQFVQVRLKLTVTRDAAVIPYRAVNEGPQGRYVWVVSEEQTVAIRPITVLRRNREDAVVEGLKPDEQIVTDGQLTLRPGAKVLTREQLEKLRASKPAVK